VAVTRGVRFTMVTARFGYVALDRPVTSDRPAVTFDRDAADVSGGTSCVLLSEDCSPESSSRFSPRPPVLWTRDPVT